MTMLLACAAALLVALGALLLYLATPHQRLFVTRPKSIGYLCVAGGLAILIGLLVLVSLMGAAAAVFTWVVGLMVFWTIPPVLAGWLRYRKSRGL